jgi:NAD(P)-dependent dehydrogenase (short-subunit alcohol dehydrogenase family)
MLEAMYPHKYVVITGSTRGLGFRLAESFLQHGCTVTISGRSRKTLDQAAGSLESRYGPGKILACTCDVTDAAQVQALWDQSADRFGRVDIWINNAGWSGEEGFVWDRPAQELNDILSTNIAGTVYGSQTAMRGMIRQDSGAIYNMEGMGADGRKHSRLTTYGTTKYAVHYFTESLAIEARGTPVIVGSLRPGMVITDMIMDRYKDRPEEWERAKRIFNIIAERPETASPWLAEAMLSNRKSGRVLSFSSPWKLSWRFLSSPFIKRDLFR